MNVVSFIAKVSTIGPKTFWRMSPGKYAAIRGSQSIAYQRGPLWGSQGPDWAARSTGWRRRGSADVRDQ